MNDADDTRWPSIATSADGTVIFVVWSGRRDAPFNTAIYLDRSTDGGVTFGADLALSSAASAPLPWEGPTIAVGDGCVYVAWEAESQTSCTGIWMAASSDGGASFAPDFELPLGPYVCYARPVIAVAPDGRLVVAYQEVPVSDPPTFPYFVTYSYDGGQSFTPGMYGGVLVGQDYLGLAVDESNRIHLAYSVYYTHFIYPSVFAVRYRVSAPGLLEFSTPQTLTDIDPDSFSWSYSWLPSIAVSSDQVFVSWKHSSNQIAFAHSTNPPTTFSEPVIVNDAGTIELDPPSITTTGSGACYLSRRRRPCTCENRTALAKSDTQINRSNSNTALCRQVCGS